MLAAKPRSIRIITANLCGERVDVGALVELLSVREVDVAALQELTPRAAEAVATVLPHGLLVPARRSLGMGVASRNPIAVEAVPLPYVDALVATLVPDEWPALRRPLGMMTVHFSSPLRRQAPWRTLGERRTQRRAGTAWLEAAGQDRVLLGDLNASPAWPLYRRLLRSGTDLIYEARRIKGRQPRRTWGPLWAGTRRLLRIDHVLGNRGVRVDTTEVVHLPGSDHSVILGDLEPRE